MFNLSKKWLLSLGLATLLFNLSFAQDEKKDSSYSFTVIKELKHTPVKNQYRSGTCWDFSAISFFESELLRMGKGEYDLSEMFCSRYAYEKKAELYVRMQGKNNFGAGGEFHDVVYVMRNYGIVPEEVYTGLVIGEKNHVHGEMDAVLKGIVDAIIKNPNKQLTPVWQKAYASALDAYLGPVPEKFNYKGKTYTPKSFFEELNLNLDDYVELTSFSHHPFYSKFILEVSDNWLWSEVYNVPLNEFEQILDYAIDNGYTIAWGSDVSEKGFAWKKGVAVVPETDVAELSDLERAKWDKMSDKEKDEKLFNGKEKTITQEMRQKAFDNYQTTDDHGMHIVGKAKDQYGNIYFIVKNSWGTDSNPYKGYFYASKPFVLYKTTNVMVHKNAIPPVIRQKLGIK